MVWGEKNAFFSLLFFHPLNASCVFGHAILSLGRWCGLVMLSQLQDGMIHAPHKNVRKSPKISKITSSCGLSSLYSFNFIPILSPFLNQPALPHPVYSHSSFSLTIYLFYSFIQSSSEAVTSLWSTIVHRCVEEYVCVCVCACLQVIQAQPAGLSQIMGHGRARNI